MDDESILSNQQEILLAQKDFYKSLYSSKKELKYTNAELFLNKENPFLNCLEKDQIENLEGILNLKECAEVLQNMKNCKSPGPDGLTVKFYNFFWKDLQKYMINSLNYGFDTGLLSVTQRQGVITCLPKEGKPKYFLKNWRPISLLNVDYKIASSAIAKRIKTVLDKLISDTQMGFIKK